MAVPIECYAHLEDREWQPKQRIVRRNLDGFQTNLNRLGGSATHNEVECCPMGDDRRQWFDLISFGDAAIGFFEATTGNLGHVAPIRCNPIPRVKFERLLKFSIRTLPVPICKAVGQNSIDGSLRFLSCWLRQYPMTIRAIAALAGALTSAEVEEAVLLSGGLFML